MEDDDDQKNPYESLDFEHLFEDHYERVLLAKRTMKPFHLDCPVTRKQLCRCAHSKTPLEELEKTLHRGQKRPKQEKSAMSTVLPEDLAYDMHLYYEGYPSSMLQQMSRKLAHEKERMMQMTDKSYVNSFCKFIESEDEGELLEKGQVYDVRTTTA